MKHFHRRNLSHLYFENGIYFITSCLANSIPAVALEKLRQNIRNNDNGKCKRLFKKYDVLLDSGNFGVKYLSDSRCAGTVKYILHFPDGKDYKLICYCIMPDYFHLVFELLEKNK